MDFIMLKNIALLAVVSYFSSEFPTFAQSGLSLVSPASSGIVTLEGKEVPSAIHNVIILNTSDSPIKIESAKMAIFEGELPFSGWGIILNGVSECESDLASASGVVEINFSGAASSLVKFKIEYIDSFGVPTRFSQELLLESSEKQSVMFRVSDGIEGTNTFSPQGFAIIYVDTVFKTDKSVWSQKGAKPYLENSLGALASDIVGKGGVYVTDRELSCDAQIIQ